MDHSDCFLLLLLLVKMWRRHCPRLGDRICFLFFCIGMLNSACPFFFFVHFLPFAVPDAAGGFLCAPRHGDVTPRAAVF